MLRVTILTIIDLRMCLFRFSDRNRCLINGAENSISWVFLWQILWIAVSGVSDDDQSIRARSLDCIEVISYVVLQNSRATGFFRTRDRALQYSLFHFLWWNLLVDQAEVAKLDLTFIITESLLTSYTMISTPYDFPPPSFNPVRIVRIPTHNYGAYDPRHVGPQILIRPMKDFPSLYSVPIE